MGILNPKNFVEGGLRTTNTEVTWRNPRFGLYPYTKKDGTPVMGRDGKPVITVAGIIDLEIDGEEAPITQAYSIGDPGRYEVSRDGKKLISDTPITKGCNFAILMENLLNAGFPENKLDDMDDISMLDGMITYNIGIPEPTRQGLAPRTDETGRQRIMTVPSEIRKLPWEKKKSASTKKSATKAEAPGDEDTDKQFVDFISGLVKDGDGEASKKDIAQAVFSDPELAPVASALASKLYSEDGEKLLTDNGFTVDGETISK